MKQHDYKDRVVGGCLEALRGFLYSFQSIVSQKSLEKIHGYLLMLISRNSTVEKKAISFTPKGIFKVIFLLSYKFYLYLHFLLLYSCIKHAGGTRSALQQVAFEAI